MGMKYYKLFDLLNRRNITKTKMRIDLRMSTKTLAKISAHEQISLDVLERICKYLKVQPGEIIEYVEEHDSKHEN